MSRCLVTGGSGYFGSALVRRLLAQGWECAVLDIVDAADRPSAVSFFQADIRDAEAVFRACVGVNAVFHNVAQVPLAKNKHLFESVNATGTQVLLEACRRAGVRKVVYTSSSAVYGVPRSNPVTEQTSPNPGEAYGQAKLRGEQLCREYAAQGLDVTIIRPRTVLGHGRLGIFQVLFEWVRQGRNIPVLGAGNNRYQFVHADDLAEACILAAAHAGSSDYNCGSERFGTMRQLLKALCRHAGTGSKVKAVPFTPAVWAMRVTSALHLSPLGAYHSLMYGREMFFDISKAKQELGWQPRYSNEEMIRQSYDWYVANRDSVVSATGASAHRSALNQGVLKLVSWVL